MRLNHVKIALGVLLNELSYLYSSDEEIKQSGTFNEFLATIHLNRTRASKWMKNAEFLGTADSDMWQFLDSDVLELCRRKKVHPMKILHEIKNLSYTDLVKEL